ncbi:MAG: hypothetical protein Kow00127_09460 [Bacteroidales bacterium]
MKKVLFLILLVCTVTGQTLFSQTYESFRGMQEFSIRKSFSDAVALQMLYPSTTGTGREIPNEIEVYPDFDLSGENLLSVAPELKNIYQPKDPSPAPDKDFQGLDDSGGSIPPDVNGAAGRDHLMVTLNTDFRIMDKDGNAFYTVGAGAFWHPTPGSGGVFDPKISYDPYEDRWILIEPSSSDPASTRLMVAVSATSDPLGDWFMYSFDGDPQDTHWFDYPNYGFNDRWIVATGNMFGGGGVYVACYVFDKHDLYNHADTVEFTRFKLYDGFTVVPAVTYDPDQQDIYMVNNAGGNNNGSGYLKLWKVSGPTDEPVVSSLGLIQIPDPWSNGSYSNGGNFLPQLGSEEKINSVDARLENLIYRNGKLWTTHHVFLPADNPQRTAVQWFELDTTGTVTQWGRVDDPDGGMFFAFATIAVNALEDILIGFGSFSEEQYASSAYAFRYADDPQGVFRDYYQYKDGLAPYFKTFGGDRNRWGDYTATWVDPVDDLDFWTIQEYADLPGSQDHWGVWWAYVDLSSAPVAGFEAVHPLAPVGGSVDFTDLSKFTPTSWQWTFEGGTPAVSTEQNPAGIVYNEPGTYDVTLIVSNELGSDTLVLHDYIEVSTTILPEIHFTVDNTLPCTGEKIQFTDMSVYATGPWTWSFDPPYAVFADGTDEHSQNPVVWFEHPFAYDVHLVVGNANGTSDTVVTEMIRAGGFNLPFIEDFESRSFEKQSWEIENPDDKFTWEIGLASGNEDSEAAARMKISGYNGLYERDRLITPPLNFYGFKQVVLSFEYAYAPRYNDHTDSLLVYGTYACDTSRTLLAAFGEDGSGNFATHEPASTFFVPETAEDWCGSEGNPGCIQIDLSQFDGESGIRLIFESVNVFGNNIYIDNVTVEGEVNSVSENRLQNSLTVSPNPAHGWFTLSLDGFEGNTGILIYNLQGELTYTTTVPGGESTARIDYGDLPAGVYILVARDKNSQVSQRLILR